MFAPTSSETKTAKKFKSKLAARLPRNEDGIPRLLRLKGRCPDSKKTLGEAVFVPEHDIVHVFDNEMMLAVSHAIEDLASEVREGELIATFQSFENFLPSKKRYISLASDLDAVRVWGSGKIPKGCPGIDFIATDNPKLMRYWLVVFESQTDHAVMVCRQINETDEIEKKKFVGFYSFCPYLVQSIRWRFNLISSGLNSVVNDWEKSFSLPDINLRDLGPYLSVPTGAKPKTVAKKAAKAAKVVKTPAKAKPKLPPTAKARIGSRTSSVSRIGKRR